MLVKADEVLREIERAARRRYLPFIGPRKARVLAELARGARPKRVLEVGTLVGYSAIVMGKELDADAQIITIEIDAGKAREAERNIFRAEVAPLVKVIVGDAREVLPKLEGEFDFVFLDAAKWQYMEYLRLVEGRLQEGCVVVADNAGAFAYEMKDYLEHVRSSGLYESRYVPVGGDGFEVSVKLAV